MSGRHYPDSMVRGSIDFVEGCRIIERLDKGFRYRSRIMEIIAGETARYRIQAYISLKRGLYWRSNPTVKVHKILDSTSFGEFTRREDISGLRDGDSGLSY